MPLGATVQLILNDKENVVQVAEDLGLNSKTLYHWVTMYKKAHNIPTRNVNLTSTESSDEELKRLRRENKTLKQERDILYPKGRLRAKRQRRILHKKFYKSPA